ncbi:MAG: efflux RND transporter permease subunit [Anaerolineaceae bacterium]|nr:efflux RND transporter permease subunit [Anaerolineaceae bacterium]MCB9101197.1 efflux RND transporter permease subunit [Anaerolineales bacterium]
MSLTRLSINRPLTMLMIIVAMVIMGMQGYNRLKLDSFPAVDFPFVSITVVYPGASPEDVEDLVLKPIEDGVSTISGIDDLNSTATEGFGTIAIAFNEGVNGDQAAIDVERQVSSVRGQLPDAAEDPTIIKADINAVPVIFMSLSGPQKQDVLFDLADNDIKTRLQTIPGVASVSISGGRDREVQVNVDPAKLAAFGISMGDVQRKLSENNVTFPAGTVDEGRQKIAVRSVGEFTNLDEIRNLVVRENEGAGRGRVFLSDVADVRVGLEDQDSIIRYNGQEAVSISVVKSSDANTVEVVDEVIASVADINKEILPPGSQLTVVQDNADFIRRSVDAVLEDLFLAIVITGLVILVFLHTLRSTLIVILAIPTSIITTFLVMWMLGFSLNQLTLLALTLVIGILVDDAIVVLENINRHIEMKKPPKQAAIDGRTEIGLAAVTITLVDVVVYIPVAFTSGIVGRFFYSYGVTIAVAALISLFIAFTLTPMLAALWSEDLSKPHQEPKGLRKWLGRALWPVAKVWEGFLWLFEKSFEWLTSLYTATLRFFLLNFATQLLAVLLAVGSLVAGFYLVVGGFVGTEFFPQQDDGQIRISIEMPAGTNLDTTDQAARRVEDYVVKGVPETSGILTVVGTSGGGGGFGGASRSANAATINLVLVDKGDRHRSTKQVIDDLRPILQSIPEATVSVTLNSGPGGGGQSPIQFQLSGSDPNTLIDLSNQVEAVIRSIPGTTDIKNTDAARSPETQLLIDRQQAVDLGLSPSQIGSTLRTALSGSQVGKYAPPNQTEIDISLRASEAAREDVTQLLQMPIEYVDDQPIILDRVVDVERTLAPARITRSDRQRVLTVGTGLTSEYSAGDVTDEIEAAIKEQVQFPPGYNYKVIGTSEIQRESFAQLGQSILLAIGLAYMLLVALFQSWLQPLAIMFSLPVSLVGAFGGLWLTGNTLNLNSLLGIIVLIGVVTKNAILIVDFTNHLRENEGYARKEALVEAGRLRLRAVLMTTLTLVFALLPLLLGTGAGSESRAPLAAVVVGGITSSTVLTLILVPVVYNFFDWGSGLVSRVVGAVLGTSSPSEEVVEQPEEEAAPEERPEKQEDKEEKGSKRGPSPRPSPQPGSAISLNPSKPDTA